MRYVIDFGNSTKGAIGGVLRLTAKTPQAALERAKMLLPEQISEPCAGSDLQVYINVDALTLADVREENNQ